MTIWLSYVNYPITTAAYLKRALLQSGHRLRTVGPRLPAEAIELWGLQNMHLPLDPQDIDTSFTPDMALLLADTPRNEHPDLYLWVESVNGYAPSNLQALTCPKACYLIDTHYHLTTALETAKHYDYVFIAQLIDLEAFRAVHSRVYWLPLGCDPEIHGKQQVPKQYDLGFVGSMNPRREQMLDFLAQHVNVQRERSFWIDMARTFSASRIVLNDASFDDLNMRFFEGLASGSLLLSNSTSNSGQDILFHDGSDYACHHESDLLDKVRFYLTDHNLREQIAEQGRQRVLSAHTYRHRMDDLLDVVSCRKSDTFSPQELRERSQLGRLSDVFQKKTPPKLVVSASTPQIRAIVTTRYRNRWPTWQMVHEWEDILARLLGVPLKPLGEQCLLADPTYGPGEYDLMFLQVSGELHYYSDNRQLIPIVMDLWRQDFDDFRQQAPHFPLVFVCNQQAYRELSMELSNLHYLPFCLADQYLERDLPPKDIDIIHYGRRNPLLDQYMGAYLERHPETHYVTTEVNREGDKVFIHSNKLDVVGESDSRTTFMDILSRSRISLVSTVSMDGSRDTGGIDPISPRFYESLAAGCHLVGRLPDNPEFRDSGITRFCRHINSYEEFEGAVTHLIKAPPAPLEEHRRFLRTRLVSRLAPLVLAALAKIISASDLHSQEVSMQAVKPRTDLAQRMAIFADLKTDISPAAAGVNYRTLADAIGFYHEFWGMDLYDCFSDILKAQTTISEALQYQALELMYRGEALSARTVAKRAMQLKPDDLQAGCIYADLLRRTGERQSARAACLDLQKSYPGSNEIQAVLDMCDVDEQLALEMEHYHVLRHAHATLQPRRYVEIGISNGRSLALAGIGTSALGVDPMTAIPEQQFFHSPAAAPKLFKLTSNDFFQRELMEQEWGGQPFDMAFIDGLHLFEQALMDFINLERRSSPSSLIFIHDCLPVSIVGAERQRRSMVWTGDVWKVVACLKAVRPDLDIVTFPVRPSGLALVRNLDRSSKVLSTQFDGIVDHFMNAQLPEDMGERFRMMNVVDSHPHSVLDRILNRQGTWQ